MPARLGLSCAVVGCMQLGAFPLAVTGPKCCKSQDPALHEGTRAGNADAVCDKFFINMFSLT